MRTARQPILTAYALLMTTAAPAASPRDADTPPIVTETDIAGRKFRLQRFERPAVTVDLAKLSIAQRRMLRLSYGESMAGGETIALECLALYTGMISLLANCRSAAPDTDFMAVTHATELLNLTAATLPSVPAARRSGSVERYVRFDVVVPAFPVDPAPPTGPLVDVRTVTGLDRIRRAPDYPAGARRVEAQGRMIALCRIETDLSVSCVQESFNPPEFARYFERAAGGLFGAGHVDPALAGGMPSAGARFRLAVNFSLAK